MKQVFYIVLSAVLYLPAGETVAQLRTPAAERPLPEVQAGVGGGVGGLHYRVTGGSNALQFTWQAGAGGVYFLDARWGIGAGLEVATYRTKATLHDGIAMAAPAVHAGADFEWQTTAEGYRETQQATLLQVPVFVQYQYPLSKQFDMYAKGGVKLGYPCYFRYDAAAGRVTTKGYDPASNTVLYDTDRGFGTLENYTASVRETLRLSGSVFAEVGVKVHLSPDLFLYAGIYGDYGLTAASRSDKAALFDYRPEALELYPPANSLLRVKPLVGNARWLSGGVVLRLAFAVDYTPPAKVRRYRCNCY